MILKSWNPPKQRDHYSKPVPKGSLTNIERPARGWATPPWPCPVWMSPSRMKGTRSRFIEWSPEAGPVESHHVSDIFRNLLTSDSLMVLFFEDDVAASEALDKAEVDITRRVRSVKALERMIIIVVLGPNTRESLSFCGSFLMKLLLFCDLTWLVCTFFFHRWTNEIIIKDRL